MILKYVHYCFSLPFHIHRTESEIFRVRGGPLAITSMLLREGRSTKETCQRSQCVSDKAGMGSQASYPSQGSSSSLRTPRGLKTGLSIVMHCVTSFQSKTGHIYMDDPLKMELRSSHNLLLLYFFCFNPYHCVTTTVQYSSTLHRFVA